MFFTVHSANRVAAENGICQKVKNDLIGTLFECAFEVYPKGTAKER